MPKFYYGGVQVWIPRGVQLVKNRTIQYAQVLLRWGSGMDSTWGSGRELDIGKNSLVMSETGIPVGFPFPIVFGSGEKSSPEAANGDGDGEIFPRWGRVWGAIPHRKIPRCHI
jgi:hypothetical protein